MLQQLNAITGSMLAGVNQSPVPVLLPFDMPGYLADRMAGAPSSLVHNRYLSGFRNVDFFDAGASGYNAIVTAAPSGNSELPSRVFARPVEVHITGSLLTYSVADPLLSKGEAIKSLNGQYPDLRRTIREGFVRYAFTRFSIPYVVSIQCLDSTARSNRLSCREASHVAEHFLKSLRIVGGKPAAPRPAVASAPVERPADLSPDFTYRPPGELIANSGYRRAGGHPDRTVYAQIRFPIEQAPAYANSQSFMNWGDCYLKGRFPRPHDKGDAYRCRLNDKKLVFDESATENYSYPWQDNFCETRDFQAGQCPGGFGHQGQDIRPATCSLKNGEADRCVPDRYGAVAVRDGVVVRTPKQQAMLLLVNSRTEHVRFRYMHMAAGQARRRRHGAWPARRGRRANRLRLELSGISGRNDHAPAFRRAGFHARRLDLGQSLLDPDCILRTAARRTWTRNRPGSGACRDDNRITNATCGTAQLRRRGRRAELIRRCCYPRPHPASRIGA